MEILIQNASEIGRRLLLGEPHRYFIERNLGPFGQLFAVGVEQLTVAAEVDDVAGGGGGVERADASKVDITVLILLLVHLVQNVDSLLGLEPTGSQRREGEYLRTMNTDPYSPIML